VKKFFFLLSSLVLSLVGAGRTALGDAGSGFSERHILGWSVKVSVALERDHAALVRQSLTLLEKELAAIVATVPPQRLPQLRRATFWLDERVPQGAPKDQVPVFHPDRRWLEEHGLNPQMAGGIELPNAAYFLTTYSWEPWAILHELAHFYQNTVLGDDNAEIHRAYEAARAAHLYDSVAHFDGRTLPAYARENEREYFAELSEAYFGRNDFFPFTRDELRAYDPAGFAVVKALWEQS
jgi:hypothetical protein